jgi:opacity protein-like surface antigen
MAVKSLIFGGAAAILFTAPVLAADMLPPPPMMDPGPPGVVEIGTGWYLRGDVGYVDYHKPRVDEVVLANTVYATDKLDKTWSAGGGFGYKFTSWFRADVTADYRFDAAFRGTGTAPGFTSTESAQLNSTSVLLNGYLDLGNWGGVTPYVGAGIGYAQNSLGEYTSVRTCLDAFCGTGLALYTPGNVVRAPRESHATHNLAWALMGGVAVDAGGGFKLDLGYRYVNLGDAETELNATRGRTRAKDLESHEVRLGVRYMID